MSIEKGDIRPAVMMHGKRGVHFDAERHVVEPESVFRISGICVHRIREMERLGRHFQLVG